MKYITFKRIFKKATPRDCEDDALIIYARDSFMKAEDIPDSIEKRYYIYQYQYHLIINLWFFTLHLNKKSKIFKKYTEIKNER